MRTNNKKRVPAPTKKALSVLDFQSNTDVLGSYTGINLDDIYEKPIQDVDDL